MQTVARWREPHHRTTIAGTARGKVSVWRARHLVDGVIATATHIKLGWSLAGHATYICDVHLLDFDDHSELLHSSRCHVHDRKCCKLNINLSSAKQPQTSGPDTHNQGAASNACTSQVEVLGAAALHALEGCALLPAVAAAGGPATPDGARQVQLQQRSQQAVTTELYAAEYHRACE